MANKTIRVNLQFNADTENAKKQIASLQQTLNTAINNGAMGKLGVTNEIQQATRSAMDLKIALNNATNVDTGKLNLNKFQSELKRSGRSIEQYAQQLKALGPAGVQAFNQMASAVASADTKLISLSGGMKKLTNTLFNTMRWSVASAAIQGVTSAISDTVNYAKELDTSLNNIRIVTGKSAEEMARFAKEANKMAKQLATTTTKYSDASLIYYQQGLSSKEVKERTDVTVKLANVVGENAQTVSEWMTAIWNNFDDGSRSLEAYADVLAKLGAATASSADEIAGGLEKFAAVADTIGLSYEYAASMLATITAETRQSEDVVGTALKTILSRMEQLNQGEMLDDGTTLGKYSLALQKVGVDIKNANGELKDMDVILEQTGQKWDTLARDQQIALAQSVAGIRQYTQFMALMDNWDVMEKNLRLTEASNGALQDQQEIYEDSLEAAENRMTASAEKVKSTLLDADNLKPLYNFASGGLEVINELLEAFGGLPTILLAVAAALTKIYQPQVASFFSQMAIAGKDMATTLAHPIKAIKGENVTQAATFQNKIIDESMNLTQGASGNTLGGANELNLKMTNVQKQLVAQQTNMTAGAKQRAEWELEILQYMQQQLNTAVDIAAQKDKDSGDKQLAISSTMQKAGVDTTTFDTASKQAERAGIIDARMNALSGIATNNQGLNLSNTAGKEMGSKMQAQFNVIQNTAEKMGIKLEEIDGIQLDQLTNEIQSFADTGKGNIETLIKELDNLKTKLSETMNTKLGAGVDNTMAAMGEQKDLSTLDAQSATMDNNINSISSANLATDVQGIAGDNGLNKTSAVLDSLDTSVMDKAGKAQVTKWKQQAAELGKLDKRTKAYKDGLVKLNKSINQSTQSTEKHTGVLAKNKKNIDNTRKSIIKNNDGLKEHRENTEDSIKTTREAAAAQEGVNIGIEEGGQQIDNFHKKLNNGGFSHWSDTLASGLSAITSYAMGLSMLSGAFENLFKGIAEGNLTFGDFLSSMTSILMSASMVIPSIIQMTNLYRQQALAKQAIVLQERKEQAAQKLGIGLDAVEIMWSKIKHKQTAEEIKDDKEKILWNIMNGVSGVGKQAGQGPKGWITAAISLAMLVPLAAMVGVGIAGGISAGHQTEAEVAAEEEETLKGQADDKKQEYDDFKSALSDYKDAQENIDKLTEGTQEWTEALMEANAQIVDLLSKYPELAQFVSTATGRMTISDEGWTYVSEKLMKQAAIASTMAQAASIRTQEAQLKEKSDKLLKSDDTYIYEVDPTIMTDSNMPAGRLVRADAQGLNATYLEDLVARFNLEGEQAFLGLEQELENMGATSDDTAESLKQIVREQQLIQQQEELLMKTRMNNLLGSQLGFNTNVLTPGVQKFMAKAGAIDLANATDGKGNKIDFSDEAAKNIAANWYSPILDVVGGLSVTATAGTGSIVAGGAYAANRNKINTGNVYATDTGWSVYATDRGKQAFQDYATAMGLNVDEDSINFQGNHVTYKLKDGDADEEIKVSYETLLEYEKQAFLEARAAEYTKLAQSIYSTSNKLLQSDKATDQAIGEYLASGDIQALDIDTFRELKNTDSQGLIELLENSAEGIEFLDEIGLSAEQIAEDIKKQLNSLSEAEVIRNRIQRDRQAYNDTIASGAQSLEMDANALKAYAEHLADVNDELDENTQATADVAVEHFKMSKGLIELRKTLKDNIDTLQSASKNSLEYAEALGAIKTSVDKVFGTNVSFDFIENNLSQIQSMLDGSVESYNQVRKALVSDWVQHLALDDYSIQEIDNLFSRLMDKADEGVPTIEITADDTEAINMLNDLVRKGQITSDELEGIFKNANLAWDSANIQYYDLPQGTTSKSTIKVTNPDGTNTTYETETYNETTTRMPWIGDNPPQFNTFSTAKAAADAQSKAKTGEKWIDPDTGEEVTADNWGLGKVYQRQDTGKATKVDTFKTQQNYVTSDVLSRDGEDNETAAEQKKRWKELDDEIERYHEIDEVIQDIERDVDKLTKAKDRAFGANKLALMDQEIGKQKELLELAKERAKDAETYYEQDRSNLLKNYAVTLDSEGRITNYNDLIQEQIDKLKGMKSTDSNYNTTQKYLEQMKADFAQYEETLDELNDEQQNVIDKQYELQDLAMEKIEYTVQIKVDAADDDLARIDFLMQTLEDDAFKAAEAIGLLGESAQANIDKYSAANEGYKDTQRAFEAGEISAQQAADALRQYRDDMIEANAELLNLRATVQDKLTEAYDAWNEKLDKNAEKIDFYSSVIDNYKNIIDMVGKDNLGVSEELLKQMNQASVDNANNALKASKSKLEANEKYLENLRQKRAAAEARGDTESVKEWDKQIEYAEEQVRTATEEFNDSWSNALEATAEAFSTHVDSIIENFSESVSGVYKNLEQLQEAFDRQTEINDRYLEQYEKTYEINKLNRSIQDSIDKTDNVGSQKELRKLQQELLVLNEAGVNVSQRDIEYMQKKYDLMVAEQALKEAQNAKSIVRLQRDSEGNFGYVYTADQANVDNAQQNYEDKLYAMQKFGDESLQEISEQVVAINAEFAEAIKAIEEDATLSWEEKQAKIAEVTEYYTGKLQYWTEEGTKFLQYGKEMNTEYNAGMAQSFHDTTIGSMYPDMESFRDLYTNSQNAMTVAGNEFIRAIEQYGADIDTVMNNAGTSVDTFATEAKKDLDKIQQESEDTAKAAQDLANAMDTDLNGTGGAVDAVESFQLSYSGLMEDIRNDTDTTLGKIGELLGEYEKLAKAADKDYTPPDRSGEGDNNTNTTVNNKGNKSPSGKEVPELPAAKFSVNQSVNARNADAHINLTGKNVVARQYDTKNKTWEYQIEGAGDKWIDEQYISKWVDTRPKSKTITLPDEDSHKTYLTLFNKDGSQKNPSGWGGQGWGYYRNSTITIKGISSQPHNLNFAWFMGAQDWANSYLFEAEIQEANGKKFTAYLPTVDVNQILGTSGTVYGGKTGIATAYNFPKFDTGGYTGSWGPEGRLAMLHQKEIVLNAHDTANLLTAVDIVRSMADKLEMNASLASQGIAGLTASITPYHGGDTLEQNVTIHAEFPNATNHSEIEEAFGNLVNLASQYANRK